MIYYYPGCKYKRLSPLNNQKITEYLLNRFKAEILGCCSKDHNFPTKKDTIVYQCPTCGLILSESSKYDKLLSVYELIDSDESFIFKDYNKITYTIQDCIRTKDNEGYFKAVRSLLRKMNINYLEIENNGEKADYCGPTLYRTPSPRYEYLAPKTLYNNKMYVLKDEDTQKELMLKHGAQYKTDEVICYCTGCLEGIKMSNHKAMHLLDLIAESL